MKFKPTGDEKPLSPGSPPSRGAWIEISPSKYANAAFRRRPPHGGRGLKFVDHRGAPPLVLVAPLTGGVD